LANPIALSFFFCAPLASLSAASAASPRLAASFWASARDSAVVGGMGRWSSRRGAEEGGVEGVMERAAVRAVVTGLRCFVTCVS